MKRKLFLCLTVLAGAFASARADTASVVSAANTFLNSLTSTQRASVQPAYTLSISEQWSNLPGPSRNGPTLGSGPAALTTDLSGTAQTNAIALCQAALSGTGYTMMNEIRLADNVIRATNTNNASNPTQSAWSYGLYHIAVLGEPSTSTPWMLQISGHHLTYNITYNAPYVSATPMFIGVEPPNWTALSDGRAVVVGQVNGTTTYFISYPANSNSSTTSTMTDPGVSGGTGHAPLENQRAACYNLATAVQADSNVATAAKLSGTFTDVVMGVASSSYDTNFPFINTNPTYPTGTTGRGVLYSSLNATEKAYVKATIVAWVNTQASDIATSLLGDYESDAALNATYIGYGVGQGGTADFTANINNAETTPSNSQHSYIRIDGPRVWIEFVVQAAVAFQSQGFVHYHSLWRDKLADYGNEFGGYLDTANTSITYTRPSITSQPASTSVTAGGSASFSVTAAGTATLSYQWYKDGAAINGATSSSYSVANASSNRAGNYYVVVTNPYGLTTSSSAALAVYGGSPVITTTSPLPAGIVGTAYSQTLTAAGGSAPYSWTISAGSLPPGLNLSAAGVLSGTPTFAASYNFTAQLTDNSNNSTSATFAAAINAVPAVTTGAATAVGNSNTQAQLNGVATANGLDTASWFEYGPTTGYGSSTLFAAADTAESYSSWAYGTTGGTGLGAPTYLEGINGGIFLANASTTNNRQIDGNESFGVFSGTGSQALYRALTSPHPVGNYTLSARFDVSNVSGFSGFNMTSAPGASFVANELLAFGLNPSTGNTVIYVRGSTPQTINLGSEIRGAIIDFQLSFDATAGIYTLGAKFRASSSYTTISGNLEASGTTVGALGFANYNSGSTQNLIFDDLSITSSDSIGSGYSATSISALLASLSANNTYHFHAVAQNSLGTTYGADQIFGTNVVNVTASTPDAQEENAVPGVFTISQGGSGSLSVNFIITGTAAPGSRYSALTTPVTLSGSTGTLSVTPIPNNMYDGDQTVVLSLAAGNYLIGSSSTAVVTIHDKPYDAWRFLEFGADATNDAISGPLADPDGDGLSNLLEYALGRNPTVAESSPPVTIGTETDNSTGAVYLTLTYSRLISAPDLTYTVEVSNDLASWNSGANYSQNDSTTPNSDGLTETVVVRIFPAISSNSALPVFAHLKVTEL